MNLNEIIGLIIVGIIFLIVTHYAVADYFEIIFYTPRTIYKQSRMGWPDAIITYILIFPWSFIFGIGGILRWLFTMRRK